MNCQEVMDYMQRQLDGDLDERETEILMNHTRHCSDCAAMFERLKLLNSGLESLPKVVPSFSLVDAILPRLAEQQQASVESPEMPQIVIAGEAEASPPAARRRPRSNPAWRSWLPLSAAGGALAACVIVIMFFITSNGSHRLSDSDSGNMTADATTAADSAMNAATADTSASNDAAATNDGTAKKADEASALKAQDNATNDKKVAQQSLAASVDPNGETMPPLATGNTMRTSDADQSGGAQSPNYVKSNSGTADQNTTTDGGQQELQATNDTADSADTSGGSTGSSGSNDGGAQAQDLAPAGNNKGASNNSYGAVVVASPISPDKQYQAFNVDGKVSIYTVSDSVLVFESKPHKGISNLKWSDDSKQLTFDALEADGSKHTYVVAANAWTEQ